MANAAYPLHMQALTPLQHHDLNHELTWCPEAELRARLKILCSRDAEAAARIYQGVCAGKQRTLVNTGNGPVNGRYLAASTWTAPTTIDLTGDSDKENTGTEKLHSSRQHPIALNDSDASRAGKIDHIAIGEKRKLGLDNDSTLDTELASKKAKVDASRTTSSFCAQCGGPIANQPCERTITNHAASSQDTRPSGEIAEDGDTVLRCIYHSGTLEIHYPYWIEQYGMTYIDGALWDQDEELEQNPGGFIYICCNTTFDKNPPGCKVGRHVTLVGDRFRNDYAEIEHKKFV